MDFSLDSEQSALRDAVRSLLKGYDGEQRRQVVKRDPGFDEDMWRKLAEMGVLGLPFAEDDGGMGAGPVEVAVVAEEIGRVIAPEPFVQSVVLAGGLVAALGEKEQRAEFLGALSEGSMIPAVAWATVGELSLSDGKVSGVAEPVLHGDRADQLLVRVGDTVYLVAADGLKRSSYATMDGGRAARITFDGAPATRLGDGSTDPAAVGRALAATQIAYCHESLGAMDTALQLTTSYLTSRKQFGVTLNRFQALTFRAADMYTSLELTRSIVGWATMVLADPSSTPERVREAASRAKLQVSNAGRHIGQETIQLHGGIAMTDEYSAGHFTARLTAIDHLMGDGRAMTRRLMGDLTGHGVIDPF